MAPKKGPRGASSWAITFMACTFGAPVSVSRGGPSTTGTTIVLNAVSGGHFVASGAVNGAHIRFLIDTGATLVSIPAAEATRLGIDYRNPLSLAATDSLPAGKYLILASVMGYLPSDNSQQTRMKFYLSASAGTLYSEPIQQSVDQATTQGGTTLVGWLENASASVVTMYGEKQNTGTAADTSTTGMLLAIRMSDLT